MKLNEFMAAYKSKDFDTATNVWCDWFCSNEALVNRMKNIAGTMLKVAKLLNLPGETTVWMKNCCPCCGGLFDLFGFENENGDELVVTFFDGYADYDYNVYFYQSGVAADKRKCTGTNNRKDLPRLAASFGCTYEF